MGNQAATNADAVSVQSVTKTFGQDANRVTALRSVTVDIKENEFFTLLGPSGCGKTTLLRMIAGFEHPDSGSILLHGKDISGLPPYKRPVNTVFQSYALFPHMTVLENIRFGLRMLNKTKSEITDTADRMLALVRMEDLRDRKISQISGGQQQRVALARALAPSPEVLLLDEPLSALDLKLRKEMQLELKRLQLETGITFVFVTHDQEEALTMSDRLAVMNEGAILQIGSPREIYDHPSERFVANFIGDTNFLDVDVEQAHESASVVARLASGKTVSIQNPDQRRVDPGARISVVVRPEHATLTKEPQEACLSATLNNIVYFGTDTRYHLSIDNGADFVVRRQNDPSHVEVFSEGDRVGISFNPDVMQMLND